MNNIQKIINAIGEDGFIFIKTMSLWFIFETEEKIDYGLESNNVLLI